MPITVRPNLFTSAGATGSATSPAGTQAGDLLLAFLSYERPAATATLSGGWQSLTTKVTDFTATYGYLASHIWWKTAASGSETWALSDFDGEPMTGFLVMAVAAVTGARTDSPLFTVSGNQGGQATLITSVTSPAGPASPAIGDVELRWVAGDNYVTGATRTWTVSGGPTEIADLNGGNYATGQLTRQTLTAASTASRTHTITGTGVYAAHGFTLRLRPAIEVPTQVSVPTGAVHRAASW
jgi:hypothetical protein